VQCTSSSEHLNAFTASKALLIQLAADVLFHWEVHTMQRVMQRGAVAVLDALGFKGIYKRAEFTDIMKKLEALQKAFASTANGMSKKLPANKDGGGYRGPASIEWKLWTRFFSDSIILGCYGQINGPVIGQGFNLPAAVEAATIGPLAHSISMLTIGASITEPGLLYRGVIAFGDYALKDTVIIGPAIDEAASLERRADAAIIWFAPSAKDAFDKIGGGPRPAFLIKNYPVPLKDGSTFVSYAVNPLTYADVTGLTPEEVISRFLTLFSTENDPEIVKKKHHTRNASQCITSSPQP
jgi:hypothetical protein